MDRLLLSLACGAFLLSALERDPVLLSAVSLLCLVLSLKERNKRLSLVKALEQAVLDEAVTERKHFLSDQRALALFDELIFLKRLETKTIEEPNDEAQLDEAQDDELPVERFLKELSRDFSWVSFAVLERSSLQVITVKDDLQPELKFALKEKVRFFLEEGGRENFIDERLTDPLFSLDRFSIRQSYLTEFSYGSEHGEPTQGVLWLGVRSNESISTRNLSEIKLKISEFEEREEQEGKVRRLETDAKRYQTDSVQKSNALAHMSHDIRTPLNVVDHTLSLLELEEGLQGDLLKTISIAKKNVSAVRELVNDILDLSKHQAGALRSKKETFTVSELVVEIVERFSLSAETKELTFRYINRAPDQTKIFGDKLQISRIISNLVSNAIKYTDEGGVAVSLEKPEEHEFVRIKISDTGIGMTDEEMKAVFDPFIRFKEEKADGVGLGMALVKVFVEANGGKIRGVSSPGAGTTFVVDFPVDLSKEQVIPQNQSDVVVRRILLVDDDPDYLGSFARVLGRAGFEVETAGSVTQGIEKFFVSSPDAIITDSSMPDGGGVSLVRKVRAKDQTIPLLVCTGTDDRALRERLLKEGATAVLLKPVSVKDLAQILGASNERAQRPRAVPRA